MTLRGPILLGLWAVFALACKQDSELPPSVRACIQAVTVARGLVNPVELRGGPQITADGQVELRWESFDRMNIPVEGTASCAFSGRGEALRLVAAAVDGEVLDAAELAGVNRSLAGTPR